MQAAQSLSEMLPGYEICAPENGSGSVIFASPHSGRIYPESFKDSAALSSAQLRRNEDIYIDALFSGTAELGAPLIRALFPRCYIDANRAPSELPKAWAEGVIRETARAKAGLGVIPTHIGERLPIYVTPPSAIEAKARMDLLYHPYHAALSTLVRTSQSRFGQTLLIDCHSMPGFSPMGSRRPDIVLGDRFGRSCHPQTLAFVRRLFQDQGFSVAANYPYAGGFVTDHYGDPPNGVEALQIEINRDLYVNPVTLARKTGYERLSEALHIIAAQIIASRKPEALAAQ